MNSGGASRSHHQKAMMQRLAPFIPPGRKPAPLSSRPWPGVASITSPCLPREKAWSCGTPGRRRQSNRVLGQPSAAEPRPHPHDEGRMHLSCQLAIYSGVRLHSPCYSTRQSASRAKNPVPLLCPHTWHSAVHLKYLSVPYVDSEIKSWYYQ